MNMKHLGFLALLLCSCSSILSGPSLSGRLGKKPPPFKLQEYSEHGETKLGVFNQNGQPMSGVSLDDWEPRALYPIYQIHPDTSGQFIVLSREIRKDFSLDLYKVLNEQQLIPVPVPEIDFYKELVDDAQRTAPDMRMDLESLESIRWLSPSQFQVKFIATFLAENSNLNNDMLTYNVLVNLEIQNGRCVIKDKNISRIRQE